MAHEIEIPDGGVEFKENEIRVTTILPDGEERIVRIANNPDTRRLQEIDGVEAPRYIHLARREARDYLGDGDPETPDDHDPSDYTGTTFDTDVRESGAAD